MAWTIVEQEKRIPRWVYDELLVLMGGMIEPEHLPPGLEACVSSG